MSHGECRESINPLPSQLNLLTHKVCGNCTILFTGEPQFKVKPLPPEELPKPISLLTPKALTHQKIISLTSSQVLCHCTDCRKVSGSMFTTNLFVASHALTLTSGTPKTFSKKADSGNAIVSFFCGDCGTTLWRETDGIRVRVCISVCLLCRCCASMAWIWAKDNKRLTGRGFPP